MLTEKPKSIIITIRDRKINKSESMTVYGTDIAEVRKRIESAFKK